MAAISTTPGAAELIDRIRRLERELHELRRTVAPAAETPASDYTALTLGMGDAWYAVDVARVVEVLPMAWTEPLPDAPAWVRGALRFGDEVVTVIDLRCRLGGPLLAPHLDQRIVLAALPRLVGFVVDGVGSLLQVTAAGVHPPPEGIPQAPFIMGGVTTADLGIVHLLSLERLSRDSVWEAND